MTLRVGVAGGGRWAESLHLPALLSNRNVDVVGIWTRDEAQRDRLSARFGVPTFAEYAALIEASEAIDIVVAPDAQPALAITAAEAGRHLILEKPVALTAERAEAVAAAVSLARVAAVVFVSRLFDSSTSQWIDEATVGTWREGRISWRSNTFTASSSYAGSWRGHASAFDDVGPHIIAVAEAVLGPVSGVDDIIWTNRATVDLTLRHRDARCAVSIQLAASVDRTIETYAFSDGALSIERTLHGIDQRAALGNAVDALEADIRSTAREPRMFDVTAAVRASRALDEVRNALLAARLSYRHGTLDAIQPIPHPLRPTQTTTVPREKR